MNETERLSRRAVLVATSGLALAAIIPQLASTAPLPKGQVHAIAFDRDRIVLAVHRVWLSDDEGATWTELNAGDAAITALVAQPGREGRIFAGTADGRVLVSGDRGASWTELGAGLPGAPLTALAIAAHAPETLYAAIEGDGLWTSKDAGVNWEFAMDRPFEDGAERDLLTLASVNTDTGMGGIWLYAGTETGLMRVPDCFCRWQDVQPGNGMDALVAGEAPPPEKPLPEGEPVWSLAASPQDGLAIYAGRPSGTWKSADAGANWARLHDIPTRLIAVDPDDPKHVVASTDDGILTSPDGGLNWTALGA